MTKVYKASFSKSSYFTLGFITLVMLLPVLFGDIILTDISDLDVLIYLGITALTLGLFAWIFMGTYYTIHQRYLYHRSGPFFGKMKISSIKRVKYHSGWYVPVFYRPATTHIGVIITYNKFDDIYFSPKDRELFVKDLLHLNPDIEVVS